MKKFFRDFLRDETGAAAAEYALILAIVGSGLAVGALTLGNDIAGALEAAGDQIAATDYSPT